MVFIKFHRQLSHFQLTGGIQHFELITAQRRMIFITLHPDIDFSF